MATERKSTTARVMEQLIEENLTSPTDEYMNELYSGVSVGVNENTFGYAKREIEYVLEGIEKLFDQNYLPALTNRARLIEKRIEYLDGKVEKAASFDPSQKEVIEIMQKRLEQCTTPGGRTFYTQYLDKLTGKTSKLDSEKTEVAEYQTIPRAGF